MIVLAIGDVVGEPGVDLLCRKLRLLQRRLGADLTVVNGENAAGRGITPRLADEIFSAGADVITLGNHTFGNRQICDYLDDHRQILRPMNFPPQQPGQGYVLMECCGRRVCVCNLQGQVNLDYHVSSPFVMADRLFQEVEAEIYLVDFHAEATSEKLAMGYMLDGRVSAVWGTHTHVPTADARVLPKGTGYVTDLGMTGPRDSVLGIRPELSIAKFRGDLPERYRWAEGASKIEAVLFTIDSETGKCRKAERVDKWD